MTKLFTLHFANLYEIACRSLSIIGKRAVDDNGNTLFDTITPSTREEPLFHDFFNTAITSIVTELRKFIKATYKIISNVGDLMVYDFDGFLDIDVQIEEVGVDPDPLIEKTIVFSNIRKMFLLRIGLKYFVTWTSGAPYNNGYTPPSESAIFRYDDKLYQWNGTDLVIVDDDETEEGFRILMQLAEDYNNGLDTAIQYALQNYCVAYALYSWFTITAPRLTEKYLKDALAHQSYIISCFFHRKDIDDLPNPLRELTEPNQ